jgi:hypothetical protein
MKQFPSLWHLLLLSSRPRCPCCSPTLSDTTRLVAWDLRSEMVKNIKCMPNLVSYDSVGKGQEDPQVRASQAHAESQRHPSVSKRPNTTHVYKSNLISARKENQLKQKKKEEEEKEKAVRRVCVLYGVKSLPSSPQDTIYSAPVPSSLFLQHNTSLVPPYRVLIDTNFINFSLQNKLELVSGMMDCLYAKCKKKLFSQFEISRSTLRHPVCHRLRSCRVGEAWSAIPSRSPVSAPVHSPPLLRVCTLHT